MFLFQIDPVFSLNIAFTSRTLFASLSLSFTCAHTFVVHVSWWFDTVLWISCFAARDCIGMVTGGKVLFAVNNE